MCVRTSALLLLLNLLLVHLWITAADRQNDKRTQNQELRSRRHDTEERHSGRRWTTSRNSPYQKIVSSYERAGPDASEVVETEDTAGEDEAKAKSQKRKQWRTSASAHDQITSETSSAGESGNEEDGGNDQEDGHHRTPRRRSTTSHPSEVTSESSTTTTVNPKKRRRPSTTTTTTTLSPQTMSDSLYQYFRPLEQDVPQDDIIPFLDFGRKLSPVIPTPSGANSIENRSSVTKLRAREHHGEKESDSSDEEILQEDMDVTVVKKAIERNSVPRGKLRVQSSGISDYYRKRVPSQIRTTENLISTSDSSTAASIPGGKHIGVLKKINRHHVHHIDPSRLAEKVPLKQPTSLESHSIPKDVEILLDKRKQTLLRTVQRSGALKQDTHSSPLTAESTLVKTVIKEVPEDVSSESESYTNASTAVPNSVNSRVNNESENLNSSSLHPKEVTPTTNPPQTTISVNNQETNASKVLSTAVVTSVSVQEPIIDSNSDNTTETPPSNIRKSTSGTNNTQLLNIVTKDNKATLINETQARNNISNKHELNYHPINTTRVDPKKKAATLTVADKNFTLPVADPSVATLPAVHKNVSTFSVGPKNNTTKNFTTPTISRDIYRQRNPSRIPIHLPRQLSRINSTQNKSAASQSITQNITASSINTTNYAVPEPVNVNLSTEKVATLKTTATTTESTTIAQTTAKHITTESPKPSSTPTSPAGPEIRSIGPSNSSVVPHYKYIPMVPLKQYDEENKSNTTEKSVEEDNKYLSPREGHSVEISPEKVEEHVYQLETEYPLFPIEEPSEAVSFVPVYPDEEVRDDLVPTFFTTPTPVVDTRPETELAVVEEQTNSTTSTSKPVEVTDWVKASEVNKEVEVVYPESLGLGTYLLAALGVVPVVLGALVGARFILAHNKKKVLDESEYSSEYNRSPLGGSTSSPLPTKLPRIPTHVSWSEREPEKTPLPATTPSSRWEFPREKLRLQTLLGQGNFGQVWKAEADDIAGHEGLTRLVAVKTVKESANAREREDLLRELGIMQELGSHPNVVTLLGCCTEKEPIYLVMEYVMYGKLLSFLRDHRTRAHYYNFSDATDALTSRDLTVFGYCVARGMDYLANKSIIHRDIAARNVLVDHNKLCKIADFGMSRNVRDTGEIYEQRQSKGALPIRWMAPESLHFSLFTHKTDVWSFGILMWEIVTLGSTPYATMGAREVMRRVRDGYRLDRPPHCRPELFKIITRCWHSEPSKRPSFAELKVELAQLLSDPELHGSFVDLDSFADEMRRDTLHRHH